MRSLHLHGLTHSQADNDETPFNKVSPGCDAPVPTSLWPVVVASLSSSSDELFTSDEEDDATDYAHAAASFGLPYHCRPRSASFTSGYTQKSVYSNPEEQKLFGAASSAGDSSSEVPESARLPAKPKPIKTKAKIHGRRHASVQMSKKTEDAALATPPQISPKSNTTSSWSSPSKSAGHEKHRLSYLSSPSSPKRDWRYQVCLLVCAASLRL